MNRFTNIGRRDLLAMTGGLAGLALAGCGEDEGAEAGSRAPDLAALTLEGEATTLASYPGQATVVSFWLAGCAPCLTEMPILESLWQAERHRGLSLLAVSVGCTADVARQIARETGATFPFVVDELGLSARRYEVAVYPTLFVLDGEGIVRARFAGEARAAELARVVDPLLARS